MSDVHAKNRRTYVGVWIALAVLTAIEVGAAIVFDGTAKWMSLVILAVAKAACVAWWYMHLNHEYPWLKFIAVLPVIAAAYAVLLMKEVVAR